MPLSEIRSRDGDETRYIVCVSDKVSETGEQDITAITNVLEELRGVQGKVILRSTILPDQLESLPFDYYLPEFLHDKTAVEDSLKPSRVVVGVRDASLRPEFLDDWLQHAKKRFIGTPLEASYIKYLSNIWNATRVAFVNEFGSAIASAPTSPKDLERIGRIVEFVLGGSSYVRFGQAFGGNCLPKDTRAFLKWSEDAGHTMAVLQGVCAANLHHRTRPEHDDLPVWFSEE
jgi:UDP-glucose 6-dehydrogenase